MAIIRWRGAAVRRDMERAAGVGIMATMAACVVHAKDNHPDYPPASDPGARWAIRTSHLLKSIEIFNEEEGPQIEGERIYGRWGSKARYALYLEIGTSRAGMTAEDRVAAAHGDIDAILPPQLTYMAPRPYIRPAIDAEYPRLAERIAIAFRAT